jgi:D-beta-D-heptose 7-phosphate kinase/D-beta-D-heptose 1-phosphate adenosyltransferase
MINVQKLICQFLAAQEKESITVAVVGDILLDEYYEVRVNRISPEFPVPVMLSRTEGPHLVLPGGAALTAWALTPFNTKVALFGCVDNASRIQLESFPFDLMTENHHHQTPLKRRFYDKDFALPRWDIEEQDDFNDENWEAARERLVLRLDHYIEKEDPDIIILSDYGKGLFQDGFAQEVISLCNDLDVPTIVDPKGGDLSQWYGCTIFKPNKSEADSFVKTYDISDSHAGLTQELHCEATVVTAGGDGVVTYPKKQRGSCYTIDKPVSGHPLGYSGAGDCFAAVYAIAYAHNFNVREASMIAYNAASIYVQTKYNNPVTPHQLRKHIDPIGAKMPSSQELTKILEVTKGTRVFTNGCFDLLHGGHIHVMQEAKKIGDVLIVAVDSDENVKRLKGEDRPVNSLYQRMQIIASLGFVDFVVPFTGEVDELLRQLPKMDFLVKSSDYKADEVIGADLVEQVVIVPRLDGYSTTDTVAKIKNKTQ